MPDPVTVIIEEDDDTTRVDPRTGTIETDQPDGGVIVNLDAHRKRDDDEDNFYDNLAEEISPTQLSIIGNELVEAISADDRSREGHLATVARGIELLGLKLEEPKSTIGDSATSVDGMSSVTNPLLLDAVLKGWANAQGEFLPADGPVKIRDDGEETAIEDDLAEALERDFNHYLTKTASEYYPDTSHMLLWGVYFGGSGFKKVYRCPMRRRPVSESVAQKDLIVSDSSKDLKSCARVTHEIKMRPSVMKRMQLLGAYRKGAPLIQSQDTPTAVDTKVAGIQGTQARVDRKEDQPYTVWETQCELDLPEYAPGKFKNEGIPLPYLVTIDKDSREILALRRDWKQEDEECERKQMYIRWPYVPGPGFYGTGMLNILGNSSAALTAAWREALDAGMFASFPGGLISKLGARQDTSNVRIGPSEFRTIETGNMPIQQVVMPLPYKDPSPGLMALIDKITAQSEKLAGTPDAPTAEGIQNVPVGTMLAQIEQATKVMAAAHKGMHTAQSEEFDLLIDLFRQNPEDFWKQSKVCPKGFWDEQKFIAALDACQLVPVSDPNVPSHIHRVMKAMALLALTQNPVVGPHLNPEEVLNRCLRAMREDPSGLVVQPPPQAGPQPEPDKMIKAQAALQDSQTKQGLLQIKGQEVAQKGAINAQDQAAKQKLADTKLTEEMVIHQFDAVKEQNRERHNQAMEMNAQRHTQRVAAEEAGLARQQHEHEAGLGHAQHALETVKTAHDMEMERKQHALDVYEATKPEPAPKKTS